MNPSEQITAYITGIADWRGDMVARLRKLTLEADPGLTEEWKWSSPCWSHQGLVSSVGAFKDHVGINFFKGASLGDPLGLFNGGLDAKATRSIKLREGDTLDEAAFQDLVREAVAHNLAGADDAATKE
ncbi:MAG: DUF1801 domain-containing protein [Dehalococcoidia bacterium]